MRALPALPGRAVIAALERAGFAVIRTKGSHHFCGTVTIPAGKQ
jgi:predicted RNA binding protein YcfA (HicA-like mRNA interferase family)